LLGIGATQIEFATGQDSYLNSDSQIAIDNREFQELFGGEAVILLFTAADPETDVSDLFVGDNLAKLEAINTDLAGIDEVESVVSPLTSLRFSEQLIGVDEFGPAANALLSAPGRDEAGTEARSADAAISLARNAAVPDGTREIGNPDWNQLLIFDNQGFTVDDGGQPVPPPDDQRHIRLSLASTFPNLQTAVGGVILLGNASLDEQSAGTEQILERLEGEQFDGFDLTVTGSPVYLKEINDYLQGGMLKLGLAAIVVMAIVLWLIFRVRWRLLPLLAVLLGVVWSFSLLGLIGIDLSLVTIAGLPILIGLGIDFAIQVHNRIEEEVLLDHDEHPIGESLANLAPPLIAATITGVAAFLALRISKVPMIRDFGVLLAVGIVVLVIVGIVVPGSALGVREFKRPTGGEPKGVWVEHVVVKLGSLPTKVAPIIALVGVALFVGGVIVESDTEIESDPIKWINQDSEVVADVERLEDETGFSTTLGVLVQANNVYDQQVIDLIWDFTLDAEAREEVVTSSSLVNTMGKILMVPEATPVSPSEVDIYAASAVMPPDIARALVHFEDPDGGDLPVEDCILDPTVPDQVVPSECIASAAQINLRLAPASLEERAVLVDELEADLQARIDALEIPEGDILLQDLPPGQEPVRAVPAGLATVGIGLLENLSANRAALTYLSLSLAGLYLVLRTRSLGRAVLALVPVFLAIGISSVVVWMLDITLSPLTTVSGPLVVASVAEFSVLIMGRHIEERQDGLSPVDAIHTAARRTGRAFFTSALTIIGGFGVLILSSLPLLRDFGIIVTVNVTIALLSALVLMPPMLVWADQLGMLHLKDQENIPGAVKLAATMPGPATPTAVVGALAFGAGAVASYVSADTDKGESVEVSYAPVASTTSTTTSTTTTTTTSTTTTTLAPGETAAPTDAPTTAPSGPVVDPAPFPTERPATPVAGLLFDRLTEQGVAPNVANCAIETAYQTADEQTLIAMGIATPTPEALAIVTQGALDCGVPQEAIDGAIEAQWPDYQG
jgi:predicted RND superfamily exporter protein